MDDQLLRLRDNGLGTDHLIRPPVMIESRPSDGLSCGPVGHVVVPSHVAFCQATYFRVRARAGSLLE